MAIPARKKISDFKPLLTNLAQSSFYFVEFGGIPSRQMEAYLKSKGITRDFVTRECGLLCSSAVLPTTQLATVPINNNYMGITENIAHRRQYQDISLEFYVDKNYNSLKFMEYWMEFISSGANNDTIPIPFSRDPRELERIDPNVNEGYFIRMQYPEYYKSYTTSITKFERDHKAIHAIEYKFKGLYPYNIASIPVSYSQSEILRMQVSFKIDRYVVGETVSFDKDEIFNLPRFIARLGNIVQNQIRSF